jgi:hypothetical protein
MTRPPIVAAAIAVQIFAFAHGARAECPVMAQTCFEFRRATYVFLGDVIAIEWESSGVAFQVRFRVIERFKGVREDERPDRSVAFASPYVGVAAL